MTTGGEGGMITCNDKNLWEKMRSYKDHGKNFASIHKEKTFGFRWLHDGFGTNYRMTEMQAVIGLIQLQRVEDWNSRRNYNAYKIREILLPFSSETGPIRLPFPRKEMKHAFYKLYVYLRPENINPEWTRKNIIEEINTRGVKCFSGSCPEIYKEKAFNGKKFKPKKSLKNAKILGETSIMFLVHPTMHEEEIERTQIVLKEVFQMVSKS